MSVRSGGRPIVLNRRVHQIVTEAMRAGNYLETAAALAGVDPSTLRRWVARGERESRRRAGGEPADPLESPFVRFARDFGVAVAAAQSEVVGRIMRAGREDWRAAAWWLERRHSDGWGQKANERAAQTQVEAFLEEVQSKIDSASFDQILRIAAGEDD